MARSVTLLRVTAGLRGEVRLEHNEEANCLQVSTVVRHFPLLSRLEWPPENAETCATTCKGQLSRHLLFRRSTQSRPEKFEQGACGASAIRPRRTGL